MYRKIIINFIVSIFLFIILFSFLTSNLSVTAKTFTEDLPAPLYYKEKTTNQTLIYNFTDIKINNNRAYYIIESNSTHSSYLPLQFNFQMLNKSYYYTNYTFESILIKTIISIDRSTGFQIGVSETRNVTIPELNITNQPFTFYFGPINANILISNQAYSTNFLQTFLEKNFVESFNALVTIQSNTTAKLSQYISSEYCNSSISSIINLQTFQTTSFNETINNKFYSYSLMNSNNVNNSNPLNTQSLVQSLLQIKSAPGFNALTILVLPIIIFSSRKRNKII